MLDDKKLLQLIRYIELDMKNIDYDIAYSLIGKIKMYGYQLFTKNNYLTKEEQKILDRANKEVKEQ